MNREPFGDRVDIEVDRIATMLRTSTEWRIETVRLGRLAQLLDEVAAAYQRRDAAGLRSAAVSLAAIVSGEERYGGQANDDDDPAGHWASPDQLPHQRINELVHRLSDERRPPQPDIEQPT